YQYRFGPDPEKVLRGSAGADQQGHDAGRQLPPYRLLRSRLGAGAAGALPGSLLRLQEGAGDRAGFQPGQRKAEGLCRHQDAGKTAGLTGLAPASGSKRQLEPQLMQTPAAAFAEPGMMRIASD